MSTTPELGFEYFPSPERDDDVERISYQFLYLSEAVRKWPRFRRKFIKARPKTLRQCDHIEVHVISIFREARDVMWSAIENDDLGAMAEPRLLGRLTHAHAMLALFANPGSMPEFRDMVFPARAGEQPEIGDFNKSLWEAGWDTRDGLTPAQATKKSARRHRYGRYRDGLFNSRGRLDTVANAGAYEESVAEGPLLLSSQQSERLKREVEFVISKLRGVAKRAGLKPAQVDFLVEMTVHEKQQKDNPSAWRAIRDRKRAALYPQIHRLVDSIRQLRKDILLQIS